MGLKNIDLELFKPSILPLLRNIFLPEIRACVLDHFNTRQKPNWNDASKHCVRC